MNGFAGSPRLVVTCEEGWRSGVWVRTFMRWPSSMIMYCHLGRLRYDLSRITYLPATHPVNHSNEYEGRDRRENRRHGQKREQQQPLRTAAEREKHTKNTTPSESSPPSTAPHTNVLVSGDESIETTGHCQTRGDIATLQLRATIRNHFDIGRPFLKLTAPIVHCPAIDTNRHSTHSVQTE